MAFYPLRAFRIPINELTMSVLTTTFARNKSDEAHEGDQSPIDLVIFPDRPAALRPLTPSYSRIKVTSLSERPPCFVSVRGESGLPLNSILTD